MRQKLIFLLVLVISAQSLSYSQTWKKVDGPGAYINKIFTDKVEPSKIIVTSDQIPTDFLKSTIEFPYFGVGQNGMKISNDSGKTFGNEILKGYSVYEIIKVPFTSNTLAASVRERTSGGILLSVNGGIDWESGSIRCEESSQIITMTAFSNGANYIFCGSVNTTDGVKVTVDTFTTCQTLDTFDIQPRNIIVSTLDKNLLFTAGDNSLHHVYRSYNNGITWINDSSGLEKMRVLSLLPSSYNKAWVLAGCDYINPETQESHGKGIYISLDTGKTWKLAGARDRRVFQLAQHPLYPRYVAAACDSAGVYLSGSFGWDWEQFGDGLPPGMSTRHVAIPSWELTQDGIIVFAGVFGDGLYKSGRIKTGVEDENINFKKFKISGIYPIPFSNELNINLDVFEPVKIECLVTDVLGRIVFSSVQFLTANSTIKWIPGESVSDGIFTIILKSGTQILTKKVLFSRK